MTDELYYDAIDLLCKLIETPRTSRNEEHAADIVEAWMKDHGMHPHRVGNNIWAYAGEYDAGRPTLLLNSHIDTVGACSGWTREPLEAVEEDGRLYGLGSNDAGGPLVTLLATAAWLAANSAAHTGYNVIMAASAQEEISGEGGLRLLLPHLPAVDMAIVGEPTGMNPAIAERGLMVLDMEVRGKAGHAARNEGINAIYRAMDIVEKLRVFHPWPKSQTLGDVKISVTMIEGGTKHNVVPDKCTLVADVRTTDVCDNPGVLAAIEDMLPEWVSVKARSTRLNPSAIDIDNAVVRRLIALGKEPFGSATLSDQALMPWPSLKIGPGDSARSHTANEYIGTEEIREAIELFTKALCGVTIRRIG